MGILMACPHDDLAPLMTWMEERRKEKSRRQHSQQSAAVDMVPLGGEHGGKSLIERIGLPGQAACSGDH